MAETGGSAGEIVLELKRLQIMIFNNAESFDFSTRIDNFVVHTTDKGNKPAYVIRGKENSP